MMYVSNKPFVFKRPFIPYHPAVLPETQLDSIEDNPPDQLE